MPYEPAHDKTYDQACVTSKDQPVHPPSMARVLVYPSLDSREAVKGPCDQRRLWSDCADAQADLSFCWSQKTYCRFCRALPHTKTAKLPPPPPPPSAVFWGPSPVISVLYSIQSFCISGNQRPWSVSANAQADWVFVDLMCPFLVETSFYCFWHHCKFWFKREIQPVVPIIMNIQFWWKTGDVWMTYLP